jgi:hypothetical protein
MITPVEAMEQVEDFRVHPLGFFYLRVAGDGALSRRFHVWLTSGSQPPANDQHSHSFDITSRVLCGVLRNELLAFSETPSGDLSEFAVTYGSSGSALQPTGRRGTLGKIGCFDSFAGSTYFLGAGIVHRTAILERPCITTLTTVERGEPIFSYGTDLSEPPSDRRRVNRDEATEILRVLSSLP